MSVPPGFEKVVHGISISPMRPGPVQAFPPYWDRSYARKSVVWIKLTSTPEPPTFAKVRLGPTSIYGLPPRFNESRGTVTWAAPMAAQPTKTQMLKALNATCDTSFKNNQAASSNLLYIRASSKLGAT